MEVKIGDKFKRKDLDVIYEVVQFKNSELPIGLKDIEQSGNVLGYTDEEWLKENCVRIEQNKYEKDKRKLKV